jgi:hypothetical protein
MDVSPHESEHDAELERHGVRLQPVNESGHLPVLHLLPRGCLLGIPALQAAARHGLQHARRLGLTQQGASSHIGSTLRRCRHESVKAGWVGALLKSFIVCVPGARDFLFSP